MTSTLRCHSDEKGSRSSAALHFNGAASVVIALSQIIAFFAKKVVKRA
jgi:hypothetical protein